MGVALENALNCDHGRSVLVVLSRALAAQSKRPHIDDEWLQFVSVKGPLVPFVVRGDLEQPKQICFEKQFARQVEFETARNGQTFASL